MNDKLIVKPALKGSEHTMGEKASEMKFDVKETGQQAGSTITDGWITAKLKMKFVPEDALDGSDIAVDTTNGVVTLTGHVPSEAGRKRAVEVAKATEGVRTVVDKMTIGRRADSGHAVSESAERTADRVSDAAKDAGEAAGDGWITAKVRSQFIGVDVLEGSDIDVDTNNGVVTLNGMVKTQAAKARAEAIAKSVDGVTSVTNRLKVGSGR